MTRALIRDIETRSTIDVTDVGAHIYAQHPTTEVLCVGYCVDDEPVKIWHPGEPVPKAFIAAANGAKWDVVAHNAAFEIQIENYILAPRYGFPLIPIEKQVCTMAQVLAMALPGALEKTAKAMNLDHQKDGDGNRLMKQVTKPRKPKKGEAPDAVLFFDDAERMTRLDSYCMDDVEATREIYQRTPPISEAERQIWLLDQRINNYGFYLDRNLAEAAQRIAAAAHPRINAELEKITDGAVTAYTQVARIMDWVNQYFDVHSLNKGFLDDFLNQQLPENVRRVLELRLLGAQAAVAKAEAFLDRCGADGRVRGSFIYHAAGPGRWSSRGVQVHNLKRSQTEDVEKAVEIISTGDFDHACKHYDNPLSVIGDCVRAMIIAAPGHLLIGGDFSGIEARVTAWVAGEDSKLDVFRAYDNGTGFDPYIVAAGIIFGIPPEQVTKEQRQIGKGAELAFGFGGGVKAYRRFLPSTNYSATVEAQTQHVWEENHGRNRDNIRVTALKDSERTGTEFTDAEIERIKSKWRRAHPNIVQLWANVEQAAWMAVRSPGDTVSVGNTLQFFCDDSPTLWLTLPSGRKLAYPNARITLGYIIEGKKIVEHKNGYPMLLFKDAAMGMWRDIKVYGGLITENIVQATARDLLAEAMLRIDAAGYKIVTHVHDECVIEVPENQAEKIKTIFTDLMIQVPEWAEGMPIRTATWINQRYTK